VVGVLPFVLEWDRDDVRGGFLRVDRVINLRWLRVMRFLSVLISRGVVPVEMAIIIDWSTLYSEKFASGGDWDGSVGYTVARWYYSVLVQQCSYYGQTEIRLE